MTNESARRRIGNSDLEVFPLALGTNVFGWAADEHGSYEVLDAYVEAGGNFIDTADSYSYWAPGNSGGEAETIVGRWMADRGNRSDMVVATKVSQHPDYRGLSPDTIGRAVDASLDRLGVEVIDLYYAHFDDPETPLEETAGALSDLVDRGKVRYLGLSNYSAERLAEWQRVTAANNLHRPVALQQMYSLVERGVEQTTLPLARDNEWAFIPYYALARGFLTGKYTAETTVDSPRGEAAASYLTDKGRQILVAMDTVAKSHEVPLAAIALAWVTAQPGVTVAMSSARNPQQLDALLASTSVQLTEGQLATLDAASR